MATQLLKLLKPHRTVLAGELECRIGLCFTRELGVESNHMGPVQLLGSRRALLFYNCLSPNFRPTDRFVFFGLRGQVSCLEAGGYRHCIGSGGVSENFDS